MIVRRVWPAKASVWPDIDRVRRDMFQLFDAIDDRRAEGAGVSPPINLTQDAEAYYVRAELPGVSIQDIKLATHRNQLVLEGKRVHAVEKEKVSWHRREREEGAFNRSVTLPGAIDPDKVEASYTDGVLTVVLPKAAEHKPRTISIKTEGT